MSDWRTTVNYGSHPGAPPVRFWLPSVNPSTRDTLMRIRNIVSYNVGASVDSGWSDWGDYGVGVDWLLPGYSTTAGSSWTKTEVLIEVATGIGRPWKILWINKITNTTTGAVTYSSEESQLFNPGDSASILYDADNNTILQLSSACAMIPADGL